MKVSLVFENNKQLLYRQFYVTMKPGVEVKTGQLGLSLGNYQ